MNKYIEVSDEELNALLPSGQEMVCNILSLFGLGVALLPTIFLLCGLVEKLLVVLCVFGCLTFLVATPLWYRLRKSRMSTLHNR